MKIDEGLYKTFLEEMNALENFRIAYASLHPGVPLDREDPDVRRLIEAMALFSARTRLAGSRNISATSRRIFQQFFPYLLAPLPSMGILQALPTRQLVEPVFFPKGSEIALSPESGGAAIFRTLSDLRILPITLTKFSMLLLPDRGFRLALRLSASFARSEEIGRLSFCINHLNNYEASQMMLFNLKHHLRRASVVFDEKATETSSGIPCDVSFGMPEDEDNLAHPLQKERLFFHFPWQEVFLNVQVPQTTSNWSDFTICLDLGSGWPRNLVLNQDVFQLFAIPMVNLRQGMAQPVICNGTQERYAIRHPDMEYGFEIHSVRGVYEVAKEGMTFVKPGILSGSAPSYETEEQTDSQGRKHHYLHLHFPKAFEKPRTIATEALWFQPWFTEKISQRLTVTPFSRRTVGLKWDLLVNPVPHAENLFQDTIEGFLHFLTLTNRETLSRDDLMDILQVMGIMQQRQFQALCELLVDVRIEKSPLQDTHFSGLLKHRYILRFREYDPSREPLMEIFLTQVENILNAWISGAKIEVQKEIAGSKPGSSQVKDAQ
jgi:type VI secretion system protein ImpG